MKILIKMTWKLLKANKDGRGGNVIVMEVKKYKDNQIDRFLLFSESIS